MNLLYLNICFPLIAALASQITNRRIGFFVIMLSSLGLCVFNLSLIFIEPVELNLLSILGGYKIGLASDKITAIYASMISILYFFTNLYSFFFLKSQDHSILHNDLNPKIHFLFMPLAILASLGIAYSYNLFSLFIFYELLTLITYPLVIQSFSDNAIRAGRTYVYILLGSSLIFLIFALIFIDSNYKILINESFGINSSKSQIISYKDASILIICFVFGFSKTAIFPLYKWLPRAMVAPVPVSALLHAVAVVKSGIFALIKVFIYFFGLNYLSDLHQVMPWSLDFLTLLACFTIIFSAIKACLSENLKKILAYSTISQLSYMLLFLSFATNETFRLCFLQILSHSIAKITLFFTVGIMYIATKRSEVNEVKGMIKVLPIPTILFILASFSILGLPPSLGWLIKNMSFHLIECKNFIDTLVISTLIISPIIGCYYYFRPIFKMLAPLELNDKPYEVFYPVKYLTVVALCTYSLAIILFLLLQDIIDLIAIS